MEIASSGWRMERPGPARDGRDAVVSNATTKATDGSIQIEGPSFRVQQIADVDVASAETRDMGRLMLQAPSTTEAIELIATAAPVQIATSERSASIDTAGMNLYGKGMYGNRMSSNTISFDGVSALDEGGANAESVSQRARCAAVQSRRERRDQRSISDVRHEQHQHAFRTVRGDSACTGTVNLALPNLMQLPWVFKMKRPNRYLSTILAAGLCLSCQAAFAQNRTQNATDEHWVATWATAQPLMPGGFGRAGRSGAPAPGPGSNAPAPNAPRPGGPPPQQGGRSNPQASNLPATLSDQTFRTIVRTSIGGRRIRVELSNMFGAEPLEIGAAHVALHKGDGAIAAGTDHALTFGGSASFTVTPGMLVVSDPVDMQVAPLSDLAISLYLPNESSTATNHIIGLHSGYISKGDTTASPTMPDPVIAFAYAWISSVDVVAPADAFAVVTLGDSITDGYATTRDANTAWPTLLAKRLSANKATQNVSVLNTGISGNQVLRDGAGVSALARFDRDVLSRPGVKWVVLLEGINDINIRGRSDGPTSLTAGELIWGYRQLIARCHEHGIKVMGATVMPDEGVPTYSERGEGIRKEVNEWIRAKGNFDAVVDFDAVVRDPERPIHIKAALDPGDHIHPNDAGNRAMADAFDLSMFRR